MFTEHSRQPGLVSHEERGAPVRLGIVAGETSGDLIGAGLIRELKKRLPNVIVEGIGGPRMQAEGCVSHHEMERLSVMGLDGIAKIPEILRIRRQLAERFLKTPPDLFIGIDVPDFNLTLEQRLRSAGITTVHYVSPTVWAWRRYRLRKIKRAVDHMLTIFPFEARYYEEHHVPVTFVGHPLADEIPEDYDPREMRQRLGLPLAGTLVALLPGSRRGELRWHAALFVRSAQWLYARHPELHFVAPFASADTQMLFEQALIEEGATNLPITRLLHRSREALAASDVVLAKSGTSTLEAALLRKPMVVTYRVSALTYGFARLFVRVRHYALPNLLAGRQLVPELIQSDAVPEKLGRAIEQYLEHPEQAQSVQIALAEMHASLKQNADVRAAEAVVRILAVRLGGS
ncbi:MAG: lipid-A-disaccharide synthase [Gammaproteobacteria bacterium]|nr:lipid-A-disaccharide synthase [Gammaproteobacteria bacterium]